MKMVIFVILIISYSHKMSTILVIDDEPIIRTLLTKIIELEGHQVIQAKDRTTAIKVLSEKSVDIILCDVFLPDGNGVDMVNELLSLSPKSKVILLTAHGNISDGVQAIKNGAFDYIVKADDNRKIIPIINRAIDSLKKSDNNIINQSGKVLKKNISDIRQVRSVSGFDSIIGNSTLLSKAIVMGKKVAVTDVSVLLTGETGTGKEVFARSIHQASNRSNKPFVAINCSAFSKELLESEIFGYKAGAFTGAAKDKKGLFDEANGGTIFLDEIGEMEYTLQAKLLRVLETGEFIKIGDTKPTKVDVRVISATNRNLKDEIKKERFREDLYFRLSVFHIHLPALREHKEDIPQLCESFLLKLGKKMNRNGISISDESMKLLQSYSWPGNIRELINVMERALIVCDDIITSDDLPADIVLETNLNSVYKEDIIEYDLVSAEKLHISKVLNYTGGNKSETAKLLKIGLTTLYRKIEEYGL